MTTRPHVLIPSSIGELFDKISILEIKSERIADTQKLTHILHELELLKELEAKLLTATPVPTRELSELKSVNEALWEIEDAIRDCERRQDFGGEFIALARAVYKTNDRRAELKRTLSTLFGSDIIEQKSYAPQA